VNIGKPATFQPGPGRIRFNGHVESQDICRRLRFSNDDSAQIAALKTICASETCAA
jgi:hypothetical protein